MDGLTTHTHTFSLSLTHIHTHIVPPFSLSHTHKHTPTHIHHFEQFLMFVFFSSVTFPIAEQTVLPAQSILCQAVTCGDLLLQTFSIFQSGQYIRWLLNHLLILLLLVCHRVCDMSVLSTVVVLFACLLRVV